MILARLLTPYDYGVYSSAFIVLGFTTNLSELGFGQSMIQLKRLESRHIGTGYSISLVIGLTLSVIVFAGADALSSILRVPETASVLRVVALIVPLRSMAIVTESLLKRDLRMRTLAILQYGSMLIGNVFVTIALAWMGFGYWALVGGFLAMHLVTAAWLVVATEHTLGLRLDLASARELLPKGIGFSASRILQYVGARGDSFVISRYIGGVQLGVYNRAFRVMDMSNVIISRTIDALLFPIFSKSQGDRDAIRKAHRRSTMLSGLIFLPLSVSLGLLSEEVVLTVLGVQWVEVGPVLKILAFCIFFRIGSRFYRSINYALGNVLATSIYQFMYGLVVIIGGYMVANGYGIQGVAYVVLIAVVTEYLLQSVSSVLALRERARKYVAVHLPGLAVAGANFALSIPLLHGMRNLGGPAAVLGLYALYLVLFFWTVLRLSKTVIGKDLHDVRVAVDRELRSLTRRMGL